MKSKILLALITMCSFIAVNAQNDSLPQKSLEVYGFAMVDMGYNFDQIDPRWFDALKNKPPAQIQKPVCTGWNMVLWCKTNTFWCKRLHTYTNG